MAKWFWADPVIDMPPAYYTAIGEVLQRWAQLEYQMQEILWYGMGLNEKQGRTLTVGMKMHVIMGTLQTATLFWITDKTDLQEVNILLKGARKWAADRNHIAHGSWQAPPERPDEIRLHYMKESEDRLLPKAKVIDPHKMRQISDGLRALNVRADKLTRKLRAKQRASQNKSS